jgi:hypothetical protein
MPKIERWDNLPVAVRRHLLERMRDRSISIPDLNHFGFGSSPNLKCRTAIGTKTSVHSRLAATDPIPRHSCYAGMPPNAAQSDLPLGLAAPMHLRVSRKPTYREPASLGGR